MLWCFFWYYFIECIVLSIAPVTYVHNHTWQKITPYLSRATCPSPQSANWNDSNLILVPDIPTYSSSLASSRKIFQVSTWLLRSEATCPQIHHWTLWKSVCWCSPKAEEVYNEKLVGDLVLMLLWYLEHENWHYCLGMFLLALAIPCNVFLHQFFWAEISPVLWKSFSCSNYSEFEHQKAERQCIILESQPDLII